MLFTFIQQAKITEYLLSATTRLSEFESYCHLPYHKLIRIDILSLRIKRRGVI
jgi:hypothetical protein